MAVGKRDRPDHLQDILALIDRKAARDSARKDGLAIGEVLTFFSGINKRLGVLVGKVEVLTDDARDGGALRIGKVVVTTRCFHEERGCGQTLHFRRHSRRRACGGFLQLVDNLF